MDAFYPEKDAEGHSQSKPQDPGKQWLFDGWIHMNSHFLKLMRLVWTNTSDGKRNVEDQLMLPPTGTTAPEATP